MTPLFDALKSLAPILQQLHIRIAIGGSLASGAHGVVRSTLDVDIVAMIHPIREEELSRSLNFLGMHLVVGPPSPFLGGSRRMPN